MSYLTPRSVDEALLALSRMTDPALIAGGTDFYPALGSRPAPAQMLDLSGLQDARGIRQEGATWVIGAATPWAEIARAELPDCFTALQQAARQVGSVQVQNRATIAGNLCNASPAADGVPPLLLLEAEVELRSADGARILPLSDFLQGPRQTALGPGEIVTAIRCADPGAGAQTWFSKLGARRYLVISIAMVAVLVRMDDTGRVADLRVAVGACSPVARRMPALEQALRGLPLTDLAGAVTPGHLADLSPIDDVRATARYRRAAVADLLRDSFTALAQRGPR